MMLEDYRTLNYSAQIYRGLKFTGIIIGNEKIRLLYQDVRKHCLKKIVNPAMKIYLRIWDKLCVNAELEFALGFISPCRMCHPCNYSFLQSPNKLNSLYELSPMQYKKCL